MWKKFITFIKYHNALPLAFLAIFLGFGAAFAANPEVREKVAESVISPEHTLKSVDNSFLLQTDFNLFSPSAQITDIKEDDTSYYITYTLYTIDLKEGRWGTVSVVKELVVSKQLLGQADLGVYIGEELSEVVDRQLQYLKEVQEKERTKGETEKVVATTYSGLIGKFLDSTEEVISGYEPVIPSKQKTVAEETLPSSASDQTPPTVSVQSTSSGAPAQETGSSQTASVIASVTPSETTPPTITIIGNNPAKIPTRGTYSDNGVKVDDNKDQNLGYTTAVDGVIVQEVSLDTSKPRVYTITYTTQDTSQNKSETKRTVIIYNQYDLVNPTISLLGNETVELFVGEPFTDPGAVATDYDDLDLTNKITATHSIDVHTPGTYTVTYAVSDSSGNQAKEVTRTVVVKEKGAISQTDNPQTSQ